jgi:hypothetical protein
VLAEEVRPREPEGHHVLELIPEAVRAARLKEPRAPPEPRAHRLVQQPAIHDQIEGIVRRLDLHRAEHRVQRCSTLLQRRARASAAGEAARERDRVRAGLALAQQQHDLSRLAGLEIDANLKRGARVEAGPETLPQRFTRQRSGRRREPFRPRNSSRSPVAEAGGGLACANATRPTKSGLYGLRASTAPVTESCSVMTKRCSPARGGHSAHSLYANTLRRRVTPVWLVSETA